MRDGNTRQYNGKGVEKAISNITNIIAPNLYNKTFENFKQVKNRRLVRVGGLVGGSRLFFLGLCLPSFFADQQSAANVTNYEKDYCADYWPENVFKNR